MAADASFNASAVRPAFNKARLLLLSSRRNCAVSTHLVLLLLLLLLGLSVQPVSNPMAAVYLNDRNAGDMIF
jgi:hypothetical protein